MDLNSRAFAAAFVISNVVLFQNCAPTEFEMAKATPSTLSVVPPTVTPSAIEQALSACDQLQNPKMTTQDFDVDFDNPLNEVGSTPVCSWNQNGNVGIYNGYMTARYEQKRTIAVPAGAIVCNVDFEFVTQAMEYDDNFLFVVNDVILATNDDYWQKNYLRWGKLSIGSSKALDVSSYEWQPIVGLPNSTRAGLPAGGDYCLGSKEGLSSCSWPRTETAGKISMSIAPQIMTALGLAGGNQGVRVNFITTGDDDITKDCQHEPLSMRLKVRYIAP